MLQNLSLLRHEENCIQYLLYIFDNPVLLFLQVGDTINNPNLTKLLGEIASQGADAFYTGMTATNIVDVINANGGNFTKDDLKNYAAVEAACFFTEYRGKALYLHFCTDVCWNQH